MARNSFGRGLARAFGIKLDPPHASQYGPGVDPGSRIDTYNESIPTSKEFFLSLVPTRSGVTHYIQSLFPFWSWIFHYNFTWLLGDLIAGITVGFVVVPQGMAYALLAKLPPEFGLYTSFVGFLLYWAFATSKDITIGTVAVMSTIVGNIVIRVQEEYPDEFAADQIARGLAVISGAVLLFLGLIRAGFIVEFIPLIAIASFMTGAAISIGSGQVPALMGISGVNTREATYRVIINTLKGLPRTKLDAAMGLTALFFLYFVKWFCNFMSRKQPKNKKLWFFVSTLRMAFVVLLYILVSWLVNRGIEDPKKAKFKILGHVPSGFQHAGAPKITKDLLSALAPDIPTTILVLIIEHIAISKSFGRINNYIIDPSQELVAIGFSNIFGPFLGGYPATGSFSRTAIKSKAGVRTPLAGIFTAVIVLLALYALTSVFFYIPSSSLAALIIHAVGDLITPPNTLYQYWKTSPLEVFIFFAGVILTVFTNLENGIYLNMAASAALLLYRLARSSGRFLGRTKTITGTLHDLNAGGNVGQTKDSFLPYDKSDSSNPSVPVESPFPGVFVYRFTEGFNYTNSSHHLDMLTVYIYKHTRRTELDKYDKIGDRPWNDPGPRRGKTVSDDVATRPILRAVILDFSAVNFVDVTSVQALIDLRNQFQRYATPSTVEWYFAAVNNPWSKRALVAAGFGAASQSVDGDKEITPANQIVTVAPSQVLTAKSDASGSVSEKKPGDDLEAGVAITPVISSPTIGDDGKLVEQPHEDYNGKLAPVWGLNRPFFFIDVATAVDSAILHAQSR